MTDKIDVLDHGYVRYVDHMGDDLSVVNAARVSFEKESVEFNTKDERLISFLAKREENSPLRHSVVSFENYAPLMVARQWYKYAVASTHIDDQFGWNESSRRYVTEEPTFYVPNEWRSAPENKKQGSGKNIDADLANKLMVELDDYINKGTTLYNLAMTLDVAPEQARLFLPAYGMYVRWRWTASLGAVLHFLNQRLADDAQKEIQLFAMAVSEITRGIFPATVKEFVDEPMATNN